MVLTQLLRVLLQLTAGAFAGACLYILLVQQPARMALGPARALDDFRATIPRAERLQAPLLIACLAAIALHLLLAFSWPVAVGGALMLAVLGQTIRTVLPINRRLLAGAAADHVAEAGDALSRWGRLHAVRTGVAVVGAIVLLV